MAPFSLWWINSTEQGTDQREKLEGRAEAYSSAPSFAGYQKGPSPHLRRQFEHGRADDERRGVVFRCQGQGVCSRHCPQGTVGQDSLCANDHLWEEKSHELLGVET